jgi:hypothetical protein
MHAHQRRRRSHITHNQSDGFFDALVSVLTISRAKTEDPKVSPARREIGRGNPLKWMVVHRTIIASVDQFEVNGASVRSFRRALRWSLYATSDLESVRLRKVSCWFTKSSVHILGVIQQSKFPMVMTIEDRLLLEALCSRITRETDNRKFGELIQELIILLERTGQKKGKPLDSRSVRPCYPSHPTES